MAIPPFFMNETGMPTLLNELMQMISYFIAPWGADSFLGACTCIKKKLNEKGLIILNIIDNIEWKIGGAAVPQCLYTRAATGYNFINLSFITISSWKLISKTKTI